MMRIIFLALLLLLSGCDHRAAENSPRSIASSQNYEMFRAMYMGDLETVKYLVEKDGFDVDSIISEEYKERPIHIAAYYGRTNIIEYLVSKGADIDAESLGGSSTALLVAIWKKHEGTALTLLRLGANPDIANRSGVSPCEMAIRSKLFNVAKQIPNCDPNRPAPTCPNVPPSCPRASLAPAAGHAENY